MKIDRRIHNNCSEWDDEVEPDYDDYGPIPPKPMFKKEDIQKAIEKGEWDADSNGS